MTLDFGLGVAVVGLRSGCRREGEKIAGHVSSPNSTLSIRRLPLVAMLGAVSTPKKAKLATAALRDVSPGVIPGASRRRGPKHEVVGMWSTPLVGQENVKLSITPG